MCHISVSLVCHREKIKLDEVKIRSPSFEHAFSFLSMRPFFMILQLLGSGYHEIKVNELPN